MRFHSAAAVAAGPTLLGTAVAAAAVVNGKKKAGAASPSSTRAVDAAFAAATGTTTGEESMVKTNERLFQPGRRGESRLLNRVRRTAADDESPGSPPPPSSPASDAVDVGLLFRPRSLAVPKPAEEYFCPIDSCPPDLCECAGSGGDAVDCHAELAGVCAAGSVSDCVYAGYVDLYEELYCPFVSCLADVLASAGTDGGGGGGQSGCDCDFYRNYCQRLRSVECLGGRHGLHGTDVVETSGGKAEGEAGGEEDGPAYETPFFGCNQDRLVEVCDRAETCGGGGWGMEYSEGEQPPPGGAAGVRIAVPPQSSAGVPRLAAATLFASACLAFLGALPP